MERDEIFDDLKSFFVQEVLEGDDSELDASTPLLALGLVNSMTITGLANFISTRYSVDIGPESLDTTHLETLSTLCDFVITLRQG